MNTEAKITQMHLYRYDEIYVNRVTGLSSHLVLDHSNDMLYICDTGNQRDIRMNINAQGNRE